MGAFSDIPNDTLNKDEKTVLQNEGSSVVSSAISTAKETAKKKRGPKPKSGGAVEARRNEENARNAKLTAELDKMFAPKMWEPIVQMPAAAMMAITGNSLWQLEDDEKKAMAQTVSTAAQYMGVTNPKYLALSMAFISVASVYAPRAVKQLNETRMKRNEVSSEV